MKKKVLHVINSLTTGGAEMLLANSLSPGGLNEHVEKWCFGKTYKLYRVGKACQQQWRNEWDIIAWYEEWLQNGKLKYAEVDERIAQYTRESQGEKLLSLIQNIKSNSFRQEQL